MSLYCCVQGVSGMGGVGVSGHVGVGHGMESGAYGVGAGGATAAALSLMHALPLHYLPAGAPPEHAHWEAPPPHDKQVRYPRGAR